MIYEFIIPTLSACCFAPSSVNSPYFGEWEHRIYRRRKLVKSVPLDPYTRVINCTTSRVASWENSARLTCVGRKMIHLCTFSLYCALLYCETYNLPYLYIYMGKFTQFQDKFTLSFFHQISYTNVDFDRKMFSLFLMKNERFDHSREARLNYNEKKSFEIR